ncbi:MAG: ABC transporter ATP-binding protein [Bacillota bacterium]
MHLKIIGLTKAYQRKPVLTDLSWLLVKGVINVVTGPNGSGKSTLLKLLSGLEKPNKGKIVLTMDDTVIDPPALTNYVGLTSPELNLYGQLTALENLEFFSDLRGMSKSMQGLNNLLERVQLTRNTKLPVSVYSSGMKQRLKIALALLHEPPILLLDEPTATLDQDGKELVNKIIKEQAEKGIVLIATNDSAEVAKYGQEVYRLGEEHNSAC